MKRGLGWQGKQSALRNQSALGYRYRLKRPADELESWVVEQVRNIGFIAGDEIIQTNDLVTLTNETIGQV